MMLALLVALLPVSSSALSRLPEELSAQAYQPRKLLLAVPAGALLGFGIGHALQDRLSGYAIAYTAADAAGLSMILASSGTCNSCRRNLSAGIGLLAVSRIAQLVDLSLWGAGYYRKFHPVVAVSPESNRLHIMGGISF